MAISIPCPHCGATVHAGTAYAPHEQCDFCGTRVEMPVPRRPEEPSSWGSWIGVGIAVLIVLFLVVLLTPSIGSREASSRNQCHNNLRHIGLALANYENSNGSYPSAYVSDVRGQRLYSWRYFLLPALQEAKLHAEFDPSQAWDSPANAPLASWPLTSFRCPTDDVSAPGGTNYVVIVDPSGIFTGDKPVKFEEITDGTSNTLLAIEIDHSIPWSSPYDPTLDQVIDWLRQKRNLGNRHSGNELHIVFADVHTQYIPLDTLTPQVLRALVSRAGGEKVEELDRPPYWRVTP